MEEKLINIVNKSKSDFITKIVFELEKDPMASNDRMPYKELNEYLHELYEKDKSIYWGLIHALEKYLQK